jgi:alginate production protein
VLLLLLSVAAAAAALAIPAACLAARLVDVQVSVHLTHTRVVFELDGAPEYAIQQRRRAGASGPGTELRVQLHARGAYPLLNAVVEARVGSGRGLVESLRLDGDASGGVAHIIVAAESVGVKQQVLEDPPRIVLDLRREAPVRRASLPQRIEETPEKQRRRRRLTEDPDEKRPPQPLAIPVFGRPLVFGGGYELGVGLDGNPRLGQREDDRARLRQELELELFYEVNPNLSLFTKVKYRHVLDLYREDGGEKMRSGTLERGESWLHVSDLGGTGLGFQIGRQSLRDEREWWWDEKLDSVRVFYRGDRLEAQFAVAQELAPKAFGEDVLDPDHDQVLRFIASTAWRYGGSHRLGLFYLGQRDRSSREHIGRLVSPRRKDEVDADLDWLGFRATGRWSLGGRASALRYWTDLGAVHGRERVAGFDDAADGRLVVDELVERRVRGWAADAGLMLETALPGRPSFSVGYAIGSGDPDPGDETARAFRQTGLQDNEASFGGRTRVRYYGELLNPELSNLQVATVAVGLPLFGSSWLGLLYHYYWQVHEANFLRSSGLRARPTGQSRSLGQEVDLVLVLEEWRYLRLKAVGSLFQAGSAFDELRGELAWGAGLKLELGF